MKFSYLTALAFVSTVLGQTTFHSGLNSNQCMNVHDPIHGTNVTIHDCNGTTAQEWNIDGSVSAIRLFSDPSLCLDGRHEIVTIQDCHTDYPTQRFGYTFNGQFGLIGTGQCITVPNGDATNENPLQLQPCRPGDKSQVWSFGRVASDE